jgi:hypothetical protein
LPRPILPYLGKRFGLWPSDALGEAKLLSLIGYFAAAVHPASDLTAMDPTTTNPPDPGGGPRAKNRSPVDHATQLILRVCQLAGSASFVDDAGESREVEADREKLATLFGHLVGVGMDAPRMHASSRS